MNTMLNLSPREEEVLRLIVESYIATGAPVGSRTVSKHSASGLSPASMRNIMADLTDKGLLEQPHTSAGRTPTADAFRRYLDSSLCVAPLSGEQRKQIDLSLPGAGLELKNLLGQASKLLSTISNQVSMIVTPGNDDCRWRSLDFKLLRPGLVLAILVIEGGLVQNKLIEIDEEIGKDDLIEFGNYLNEHYRGKTLSEARLLILKELDGAHRQLTQIYNRALLLAQRAVDEIDDRDVIVEGAAKIFDHVEFADTAKMRELFRFLEERTRLLELLDRTIASEGVNVSFCHEPDLEDLDNVSIISTVYGGVTSPPGVIGVIGPMRMNYAIVVPVVDYIAKELTSLLKKRY